jgi:cell wall-associated NlpC family hydrolase
MLHRAPDAARVTGEGPGGRRRVGRALGLGIAAVLALAAPAGALDPAPVPVPQPGSGSRALIDRVIAIATAQVGDPWVHAQRGPDAFDCSGLVYYAFSEASALRVIGGRYRTAGALLARYTARGRADREHPRRGDLVIWGGGSHVGIYVGKGRAVSALVTGVEVHTIDWLTDPFTAYLHLRWE